MANHPFVPSLNNPEICAICVSVHKVEPECEACTNRGNLQKYMGMMLCKECHAKEKALQTEHQSPEKQEQRLQESRERERIAQMTNVSTPILSLAGVIDRARAIDQTVQVNSDIFNLETISIKDIKSAVMADDTIPVDKKVYRIAELLRERQEHFQTIIFEAQKTQVEAQTKQRAIQQELNTLANKLRTEEREKLQLNSPDYQPSKVKPVKPAKMQSIGSQKPTFKKKELVDMAAGLQAEGYTEVKWSTLQTIAVSRNMTLTQAAAEVRKLFKK